MIEDLAITTWSHTSYSDIWPMYYGQFKKNAPFFKHYMFINNSTTITPEWCQEIVNDETQKFSNRLCYSLDQVRENNVIWMQEDFVLYDSVERSRIEKIKTFLENSNYSFIRLIKSGVSGGSLVDKDLNIFEIPRRCQYLYSLQSSIWKKKDLYKLYDFYKPKNMMDSELYGSNACRSLNIKGCYVYSDEPKRGRLHYDSSTFPYISTALHGGSHGRPAQWQTHLYRKELDELFSRYNIDPKARGEM